MSLCAVAVLLFVRVATNPVGMLQLPCSHRYQACNVTGHEDLHGDDLQLLAPTLLDTDGTGENVRKVAKGEALHEWDSESLHHTFAPVLVCKEPPVTVGLGDAISSVAFGAHL